MGFAFSLFIVSMDKKEEEEEGQRFRGSKILSLLSCDQEMTQRETRPDRGLQPGMKTTNN